MAKLPREEMWERMLAGDFPQRIRRVLGALPSPPRCKLCNAPFRGPDGLLMRAIGRGPSPLNRRLCRFCIRAVHKHPGGAEVEISVLFADVRGSTAIAERLPPWDGIVDKFLGDGAVALFIPGFAGSDHAADGVFAVVSLDTGSTVETFRTVEEAEAMVAEVRADEAELADALVVAEFELELCAN